jgi:hypothetical protein
MTVTFKQGLIEVLKAELETFGEDATFRNLPIKIIRGTSSQTKNMRIAGFYKEESFDLMMLHPNQYLSTEASPSVNEIITIEGEQFRFKEIEVLELAHGFKMIVEKVA